MLQKRNNAGPFKLFLVFDFPWNKVQFFQFGPKRRPGFKTHRGTRLSKIYGSTPEGEGVPCLFTFSQNGAISSNAVVRSSKEEFVFNFKTRGVYFISAVMVQVRWLLWVWLGETTTRNQSWPKIYFPSLNVCNRLQIMFTLCSDCLLIECVCIIYCHAIQNKIIYHAVDKVKKSWYIIGYK